MSNQDSIKWLKGIDTFSKGTMSNQDSVKLLKESDAYIKSNDKKFYKSYYQSPCRI